MVTLVLVFVLGAAFGLALGFALGVFTLQQLAEPLAAALTAYARLADARALRLAPPVPTTLPSAEREQALAKITRDAYLLAEQTAKNNKANGVVVSGAWKLGEALRVAKEQLALSPTLEVTDRELALRLEVEVAENDPEGKHKQPKKPAPSSMEKRA